MNNLYKLVISILVYLPKKLITTLDFLENGARYSSSETTYEDVKHKQEIQQRAYHVGINFLLISVTIVFRIIYVIFIYQYKLGILQENIQFLISSGTLKIIGTTIIFLIGYILFLFKKYYQFLYGLSETAFALASTYTLVDNLQILILKGKTDIYISLPIMTSLYLIVRGLSNISDGIKKSKEGAKI